MSSHRDVVLPFRFRQSTIADGSCLYRFHNKYVLGIKEPDTEASARGTDAHAMAKRYVDYLVATRQQADWSYAQEVSELSDWNSDAVQIFLNWSRNRIFEPDQIFATEYQVRLDWDLVPCSQDAAVYSADMDLVEFQSSDKVTVRDYKSNWAAFDPLTAQAIFYPWMIFHVMPDVQEVTFTLEFMRWSIERSRTFTREHLPHMNHYVESKVAELIAAYEADDWPAAVNAGCAYCRLECPLVAAGLSRRAVGQIGDPAQARVIAQQMYALSKAYRQSHGLLKAWVSEMGPLDLGNDITLGFDKKERMTYDPKTISKLNADHGFDPLRALAVSSKEVKRIGRDYPEYVAKAKTTGKDRSSTDFRFRSEVGDPLGLEDEEEFD